MKTNRERRSPSGQAFEVHGWVDDVLDAVQEQRTVGADVEQPLHPEDVRAARLQEHRQPDAERRPVERLVEDDGHCPDVAVAMRARLVRGYELARAACRAVAKRRSGSTSPKRTSRSASGRIQTRQPRASRRGRRRQVGLRDDERVGGGGLFQRLGPGQPVLPRRRS